MSPREFVRKLEQLESLPSVAVKAIELASSQTASFEDLVKVIESDPSLASRVIKVANSPWLGCPGQVDSLERAIALLGMEMVRTLCLSMLVTRLFVDSPKKGSIDKAALWHHSIACAIASEGLARKTGYSNPRIAFVAGLLHDLGKLIFLHWDYGRYETAVSTAKSNEELLYPLEQKTFEVDHSELGFLLLEEWCFPNTLKDAVRRHHHDISELGAAGPGCLPLIVACANAICHCQMFGDSCNPKKEYDLQQVQWITGLSVQDIEEVATSVLRRYDVVAELFECDGGTAELYFSAVSRATKELSEMYLNLAEKAVENQRVHEELKKKDEQLRQVQRLEAIGKLAGGVAHGFNNLLTVISGHVELAKAGLESPENLKDDLQEIEEAASKAASLTGQLLAFGRQQLLQPKQINLNRILSESRQTLQELAGDGSRLLMDLDPSVGEIRVDPNQIQQVILNLVENALDAMPHGGQVRVQTRQERIVNKDFEIYEGLCSGCYTVFSVSDTGIGMDSETSERVFEPFFTTKQSGKVASGLGLATVYGTVKQSGGNIFVNSSLEKGTTFRVFLPTVEESKVVPIGEREVRSGDNTGILVVEDEESILKLIERALQVQGYEVFGANSPVKADEVFAGKQNSIGLLLTDVVMPGESGMDLYSRFKKISPELKVVFMSGYPAEAVQEKRQMEPGSVFIQKPFTPGQLGQQIREVLGKPEDLRSAAELC